MGARLSGMPLIPSVVILFVAGALSSALAVSLTDAEVRRRLLAVVTGKLGKAAEPVEAATS